ncbi:MAG: YciI family protein [Pseudomonadota bacterium]
MQFMILRRADQLSESARLSPEESALLLATFKSSDSALRLTLADGQAHVTEGPFPDPADMIAGFAIIDVPSKDDAVAWLKRWPATGHPVELEIRESGCPGGCAQVIAANVPDPQGKRFAILLRNSAALDAEVPVPQHMLDTLDAHNAVEAKAGVLLAADGLRGSARGARVKVAEGAFSVVDGPFTEIKEMIAGFWLIRVPALEDALAWAKRNPYPTGPNVEVEIRELFETSQDIAGFTPDLQAAEQRIRAEQLEAGMRAHFTA